MPAFQEVAKSVTSQEIIAKEVTAFMTNIGSVRVGRRHAQAAAAAAEHASAQAAAAAEHASARAAGGQRAHRISMQPQPAGCATVDC